MANQKNQQPNASSEAQAGDPLFTLHHAQAEADLQRQDPAAMTQAGLSPNDSLDDADDELANGPLDRQGQRRGQQPSTPESGSTAGHH